jgi:uncharacterized protein YjdB
MMKKLFYAFMASVALFWACDEVETPEKLEISGESQELFDSGINFSATSEDGTLSAELKFKAPSAWSVTVRKTKAMAMDWLTVDPMSGPAGEATVKVVALSNDTEEPREATVTISCGDDVASVKVTQEGLTQAVSIGLDKTSAELTVGQTLQLTATVTTTLPAAPKVIWSSSDSDVATVTTGDEIALDGTYLPGGLVTAVGVGEAIITASAEGREAQCKVIVSQAATGGLIITPSKVEIMKNNTLQLSVTDAAGAPVKATWSTTDVIVAFVDENNLLEARNPGRAVVTATADGKTGTCEVTVLDEVPVQSIAFNPDKIEMNVGEKRQLTVVFTPSNATNQTINHWFVDGGNPTVTVDDNGLVTAVQKGTAIVGAAIDTDRIARCTITVIDPDNPDITVESIVLDKTTATVYTQQAEPLILTATVTPPNALQGKTIEWKSSNPNLVKVQRINDTQAKVTGVAVGTASVSANLGGQSAACEVTVEEKQGGVQVSSISLDHRTLEMTIGQTAQLTATVLPESAADVTVTWSSSNPDVAYVTNDSVAGADGSVGGEGTKGGMVIARSAGSAIITASAGGKEASCQVTVSGGSGGGGSSTLERVSIDPASVTLALNEEKTLTLVMVPADAEVTIYWQSSDASIAKVSMISKTQAKVQGVSAGQATLTAHAGNLTATCAVTVQSSGSTVPVESVTLNVKELQLNINQQFQLVATVLPENATEKGVVWSSNVQSTKLYIDTSGKVTGLQACEATVTVRCKDNAYIYDTCKITVTDGSSGSDEEVVDLGLPSGLKWRAWNVGASKPEDYGNHYAWAETSPKSSYTSSNYKYPETKYSDGITIYAKYDTTPGGDQKTVLEAEDDAATANLGNGWRMPTFKEFKELRENCTWTWTTRSGVGGMLVTSKVNGKSIFLPAGGWYEKSTLTGKNSYGSYWTASGDGGTANAVDFKDNDKDKALVPRYEGRSVRPVKE